jgi:hypothetical protein
MCKAGRRGRRPLQSITYFNYSIVAILLVICLLFYYKITSITVGARLARPPKNQLISGYKRTAKGSPYGV